MAYIYVIRNKQNNKFYAGSTNNFIRRWAEHKKKLRKNKHPTPPLQAAWNKYGEDVFEFIVVCQCSDVNRLAYENLYIAHSKYNCKLTATMLSKAAKGKISAAKKGIPLSAQHKQALSEAKKGRPVSEIKRKQLKDQWAKFNSNTEWIKYRSSKIKERYKDPALREKMKELANRRWSIYHALQKP